MTKNTKPRAQRRINNERGVVTHQKWRGDKLTLVSFFGGDRLTESSGEKLKKKTTNDYNYPPNNKPSMVCNTISSSSTKYYSTLKKTTTTTVPKSHFLSLFFKGFFE